MKSKIKTFYLAESRDGNSVYWFEVFSYNSKNTYKVRIEVDLDENLNISCDCRYGSISKARDNNSTCYHVKDCLELLNFLEYYEFKESDNWKEQITPINKATIEGGEQGRVYEDISQQQPSPRGLQITDSLEVNE